MFCVIWYHLFNLKNMKNITKSNTSPWVFFFHVFKIVQMESNNAKHHVPRKIKTDLQNLAHDHSADTDDNHLMHKL